MLLLGIVALVGLLSDPAWSGVAAFLSALVGLALMLAGALLIARGMRDLGANITPVPHPRQGTKLVERGAYSLVRHPLYGGLVMTAIGWALLAASPLTLLLALGLGVFFDLKSRREEAWLRDQVSGYEAYMKRTRRLIPWIY